MYMNIQILACVYGLIIALFMRIIPVYHGYDSNDITRIIYYDENKKKYYTLVPKIYKCG